MENADTAGEAPQGIVVIGGIGEAEFSFTEGAVRTRPFTITRAQPQVRPMVHVSRVGGLNLAPRKGGILYFPRIDAWYDRGVPLSGGKVCLNDGAS